MADNEIDDGGRVYPFITPSGNTISKGITRRDWLAGMAMQGLLADSSLPQNLKQSENFPESFSRMAYKLADAMVVKSKETNNG